MSTIKNSFVVNATTSLEKYSDIVFIVASGKGFDITLPLIDDADIENGKKIVFVDLGGSGINPGSPVRILPNAGDGSVIGMDGLADFSIYQPFSFLMAYPIKESGRGALRWMIINDSRLQHQIMFCQPVDDGSILAVVGSHKKRLVIPKEYDSWFISSASFSALLQTGGTGNLNVELKKNTVAIAGATASIAAGSLFQATALFHEQVNEGDQIDVGITAIVAGGGTHQGLFYSIILSPY